MCFAAGEIGCVEFEGKPPVDGILRAEQRERRRGRSETAGAATDRAGNRQSDGKEHEDAGDPLRRMHTLLIGLFWRFFSGLDQEAGRPRLQPACCPHKSRQCRRRLPEPRIRRAIFDTVEVRSCRGQLVELKSPRAYHFPRTLSSQRECDFTYLLFPPRKAASGTQVFPSSISTPIPRFAHKYSPRPRGLACHNPDQRGEKSSLRREQAAETIVGNDHRASGKPKAFRVPGASQRWVRWCPVRRVRTRGSRVPVRTESDPVAEAGSSQIRSEKGAIPPGVSPFSLDPGRFMSHFQLQLR